MPKYLCREGDSFVFRRRVPGRIQKRLGRAEIYRSFKTSVPREARHRAAGLYLVSEQLFVMADDDRLSDEDIRATAQHWLSRPQWQKILTVEINEATLGDLRY